MGFVEVIARKRDGLPLNRNDVARFVRGASDGSVPPEQLAALLMAICIRGMNAEETRWLTDEMLHSGELWRLADGRPLAVDKHSTGGVGDTVSLVLAPLLASVGVPVAMMAGRGLGHSQGTLDKLEAIPGFRTDWDRRGMLSLLDRCGAAVVAQSERIAPADRTLYSLRDVTATVPSLPLIVGSIMSKKLALGAAALVLDVKWGSGAFRKTVGEAVELAVALRDVARNAGMACEALITDMNQPLGPYLGTACEVREALAVLDGGGSARLREVTLALAEQAMLLQGYAAPGARARLEESLASGAARAAWDHFVEAHGGNSDPSLLAEPREERPVEAGSGGYVAAVDGEALGWAAVDLGAGRRRRDDTLDYGAGLVVLRGIGDRVEVGQPLATLLIGERAVDVEELSRRVREAFEISEEAVEPRPTVLGTPESAGV